MTWYLMFLRTEQGKCVCVCERETGTEKVREDTAEIESRTLNMPSKCSTSEL